MITLQSDVVSQRSWAKFRAKKFMYARGLKQLRSRRTPMSVYRYGCI